MRDKVLTMMFCLSFCNLNVEKNINTYYHSPKILTKGFSLAAFSGEYKTVQN